MWQFTRGYKMIGFLKFDDPWSPSRHVVSEAVAAGFGLILSLLWVSSSSSEEETKSLWRASARRLDSSVKMVANPVFQPRKFESPPLSSTGPGSRPGGEPSFVHCRKLFVLLDRLVVCRYIDIYPMYHPIWYWHWHLLLTIIYIYYIYSIY